MFSLSSFDISNVNFPANTKHLYNICTTLAQRLLRWSNIVPTLYKCCVFAGLLPVSRNVAKVNQIGSNGLGDVVMQISAVYAYVQSQKAIPAPQQTKKHLYNICIMSTQRRRRWADVVQMLCKCFVFARLIFK